MIALPTPPRLLVFDLDGTLIDSEQDLANSVNATLAHLHRGPLPLPDIRSFIGDGAAQLLQRALAASGVHPTPAEHTRALAFFLDHYRAHKLDFTRPLPGVVEALTRLRALLPGTPMAVLTNKPVRPAREICAGLGLSPFFFQIYGGESFPHKKPDPAGLLQLLAEASALLGSLVPPTAAVMVGDSPQDIRTGHAAGTATLACTFGLTPANLLSDTQPSALVHHAADWPTLLSPA